MSLLYLSSPYSHDDPDVRQRRFAAACEAAAELMRGERDLAVFSPIAHGHAIEEVVGGSVLDHEGWMRHSLLMLGAAAGMIVLMIDGWRESKGVQEEIERATHLGIDIEYMEAC